MDQPGGREHVDAPEIPSDLLLEAQQRALVVTDLAGTVTQWNSSAERTYGWPREAVIGKSVFEVLEPVVEGVPSEEVFQRVVCGEAIEIDLALRRGDGERIRVWMSGRPIRDEGGDVIAVAGFSEDITEQRLRERNAAYLTARLQLALDAGGLGTWRWESETDELFADATLEEVFGLPEGAFHGTLDAFVDLVHPDDREDVTTTIRRAVETGSAFEIEHRVRWPDGTTRWIRSNGDTTVDAHGAITGAIACTADVTTQVLLSEDRERLMAEAVEAADRERTHRERLELLGRVNDALVSAEDRRTVMQGVVSAVVPELGDWCLIYVFPTETSTEPEMEVAHADPIKAERARELRAMFPYDPDGRHGVPAVMRTGRPEFLPDLTADQIDASAATRAQRLAIEEFGLSSIIGVPMIKRGRTLGVIQLMMTAERRRYTSDDLALAQAVAARVASKLDNVRLSEHNHDIAETLQAGLLPDELPSIPGVDVAVRYAATGEGVDVGGDFYDLLDLGDDRWAIVIGDVCGTGPAAAAITGLARHTVASTAWLGLTPEAVLNHLNDTLLRRNVSSFLTLAYGTVTLAERRVELDLAIGGHPLPIVVRADGSTAALGVPGTLLGVFSDLKVEPQPTALHPGDVVVFYTDGVTDVSPPFDLSDDELMAMVTKAAADASSADQIADDLSDALAAILPIDERNDDIALLVARVTGPEA